jgi:hypothetical protein
MDSKGRVNKSFLKSPLGQDESDDEGGELGAARLSSDGTRFAVSGYSVTSSRMCVMRVNGYGRHCPVRGTDPAWSPNGRRLIFVSHPTRDTTRIATVPSAEPRAQRAKAETGCRPWCQHRAMSDIAASPRNL